MKVKTIFGKDIVMPFLGWTRTPNFDKITNEKRNELKGYLLEIEQLIENKAEVEARGMDGVIRKLRIFSFSLLESEDVCMKALGSQIKMTASIPEVVRSSLSYEIKNDVKEATIKIGIESIDKNDYLRGFYLNAMLFNRLIESTKQAPEIKVNRIELAKKLMDAGKSLKNDHAHISPIFKMFVHYCNKRMLGVESMPETSFLINYLDRILVETIYDSGAYLSNEKRHLFLNYFGDKCYRIGKGLLYQDRMAIASSIIDLYDYSDQLAREIYAN